MRRILLITAMLFFSSTLVYGQLHKLQAIFIYNFTKHINWPEEEKEVHWSEEEGEAYFVIGIIGRTPLKSELDKLATRKKIDNRPLLVKQYNSVKEIGQPNILFIPRYKTNLIPRINKKLKNSFTLTVSEKSGAAEKGSVINFVVKNRRQNFELNRSMAQKRNLKISSYLENLAILVN